MLDQMFGFHCTVLSQWDRGLQEADRHTDGQSKPTCRTDLIRSLFKIERSDTSHPVTIQIRLPKLKYKLTQSLLDLVCGPAFPQRISYCCWIVYFLFVCLFILHLVAKAGTAAQRRGAPSCSNCQCRQWARSQEAVILHKLRL